jgi:hypothetical protein
MSGITSKSEIKIFLICFQVCGDDDVIKKDSESDFIRELIQLLALLIFINIGIPHFFFNIQARDRHIRSFLSDRTGSVD